MGKKKKKNDMNIGTEKRSPLTTPTETGKKLTVKIRHV